VLRPSKKSHDAASQVVARALEGNTVTGTVKGKLASGAVIYVVTTGPNNTQNLAIKAFYPLGSIKAKANVTVTINPDSTATFTGSGKFTGGTGAYKGSTGNFQTTGTIASDGLIRAAITGSVKY
jgi:hypothetical protein